MAQSRPGRGSDQFPLRLPDGLREELKERAEKNGRSMNAEIVTLIYDGIDVERHKAGAAENSLELERCEEVRDVQAKFIEALSAENEALKKAGVAGEQIVFQLASAISKAAAGDRSELDGLVERERERPILKRLTTVWSVIDDGH